MDKKKFFRFFAEFWEIKESDVNEEIKFDDEDLRNNSSVRFYQFIAALESNFDVKVNNVAEIFTIKNLMDNITDK